jgi:hypothetical protein
MSKKDSKSEAPKEPRKKQKGSADDDQGPSTKKHKADNKDDPKASASSSSSKDATLAKPATLERTIKWNADGKRGREKTAWMEGPVWSREGAIEELAASRLHMLVSLHPSALRDAKEELPRERIGGFSPIGSTVPAWKYEQAHEMVAAIDAAMRPRARELAATFSLEKSSDLSDFDFLLALGASRDWKSGCAICLTDKIMGTTCGCGHTETAVLRPCGHAVCANPCFQKMLATAQPQTKLPEATFKSGDKTFAIVGKKNITGPHQLVCPLCRTRSTSVFEAETVKLSNETKAKAISYAVPKLEELRKFLDLVLYPERLRGMFF